MSANPYEAEARARKVNDLAGILDLRHGHDALAAARHAAQMTDDDWTRLAADAGVRTPSLETRRQTVLFLGNLSVLRDRQVIPADPFTGLA